MEQPTDLGPQVPPEAAAPWWRVGMVWLVIGGPLVVVLASFATLGLALRYPDPVVKQSAQPNKSEMPAVQGRNHATSPAP